MTTAVMTSGDPHEHSAPERPIVLTLNCDKASQYLNPHNDVLACLFGAAPIRVDLSIDKRTTSVDAASSPGSFLELLKLFPDETYRSMDLKAHDTDWLIHQTTVQIVDGLKDAVHMIENPDAVKVVLLRADLLEGEINVMRDVLEALYPKAAFFFTQPQESPRRLWFYPPLDANPCPECKAPMRPAGDHFVCELCGTSV